MPAGGMNTQTDSLVGYGPDKANPGGLIEDNDTIGQTIPKPGAFTTLTSTGGYTPAGDITLANGKAIKTDTTTAHTAIFQAYDVDGTAYKTFATLTNGNTPSFNIAAPSGGTVAINGAVIGGTSAAAATFTTITGTAATLTNTTNQIVLGVTNTTTLNAAAPASSIVTNLPTVAGTIASTTGSNLFYADVLKCTAQTDSITTVLANVTGLTVQALVAGATYRFRCVLPGTADGTSGIKYAFKYTTATLTSIESIGKGMTASAIAVQHTTTTTDATLLFDQAAAVILVELEGTMVVNAGGTVALQIGTHTGTTTCSCYLGATMEFVRIA